MYKVSILVGGKPHQYTFNLIEEGSHPIYRNIIIAGFLEAQPNERVTITQVNREKKLWRKSLYALLDDSGVQEEDAEHEAFLAQAERLPKMLEGISFKILNSLIKAPMELLGDMKACMDSLEERIQKERKAEKADRSIAQVVKS